MKKLRWLALLLLFLAVPIGSLALWLFFLPDAECPISQEGYRALRPGMSEKEVNDLLRVPPGSYTSGPVSAVNPSLGIIGPSPGKLKAARSASWFDDKTGVHVDYDVDGKLLGAFAWSHSRHPTRDWIRRSLRSIWLF
jgi:hypothetical protein